MIRTLPAALPLLLLLGVAPGYALATALVPRWEWWLRLAPAPALSCGIVWCTGLLADRVHLHLTLAPVAAVDVLVVAAAVVRTRPWASREVPPRAPWWVPASALLAGVAAAGIVAVAQRDEQVPLETDAVVHGSYAVAIQRGESVYASVPEPVDGTAWLRQRAALEATGAMVAAAGGPPAYIAQYDLTLLAIVLLPLGLAALALRLLARAPPAAIAPWLALALPFPVWPLIFGEFPDLVDSTLIVVLVCAVHDAVRGERVRDVCAMAFACVAAIWSLHGLEILSSAVIGGPWLLAVIWRSPARDATLRRLAIAGAAMAAGAVVVTLLTHGVAVPAATTGPLAAPALPPRSDSAAPPPAPDLGHTIATALSFLGWAVHSGALLGPVLAALMLAAGYAALHPPLRPLAVSTLLLLLVMLDNDALRLGGRVLDAVWPWDELDRVLSLLYFTLPIAGGALVEAAVVAVRRRPAFTRGAIAGATAAGAVVVAYGAVSANTLIGEHADRARVVVGADMDMFAAMSRLLPRGAVVLNDDLDDSGQWLSATTTAVPYWSVPYLRGHDVDQRVLRLASACSDPAAAAAAIPPGVSAVLVGARAGGSHRAPAWTISCIRRIPSLQLVALTGDAGEEAALFTVAP